MGGSAFTGCRRGLCFLGLSAMCLYDAAAWAEIEEVVVTARKREESLQDIPVSVTAFSSAQIARPGLDDLTDLGRLAPNVAFDAGTGSTGSSNNSQVFIRGVGQVDFLFSTDPGVGIYVDDVYLPRVTGSILDLVDMERIEVLRGPQGTLFGKNTIGGAINIVTRAPEEAFAASADVTVGSRERADARVSVDVPLVDGVLTGSLSASTREQNGYVDRTATNGSTLGDVDSDALRSQLHWTPGDDWTIRWTADYTRGREQAIAAELIGVDPATAPLLQLWNLLVAPTYGPGVQYDERFVTDDFESLGTGPSFSDLDAWGTSISVRKDLGPDLWAKSITAYRETHAEFGLDSDHSPLRYMETTNDNDHEQFSQEIQLGGMAYQGRLDWVIGGFYMQESASDVFDVVLGAGLYPALEGLPAAIVPLGAGAVCPPPPGTFQPCAGGAGNPLNVVLDFELTIFDDIDIDSYAAFAHGTYHLSDRLSVTAGARYTDESKDFTTMLVRNQSAVTTVPETTVSESWDAFTPRVSVEYRWSPQLMTYVSASRGFKSGGFNGRAQSIAEIDSFDPEYVWAYEVGLKSEWFDRRLVVNVAAFHNDYTDTQLTSVRATDGVIVVVTENAGEADVDGFEIEIVAQPASGLILRAGAGYLDAEYTELDPGATVTLDSELVKTPEWTGSVSAEYEWPVGSHGHLSLGGDVTHRSAHFNEVTNLPALRQDAYTLAGAFLRFAPVSRRWSVAAFGRNLTDERYMTNGLHLLDSFGSIDANFGRPREWGLTLRMNW